MSYILSYRRYLDPTFFLLSGLPLIIRIIFSITINYFILRASKAQPEGTKNKLYLKWCATINFIFIPILLILPELVIVTPTFSPQDLTFMSLFYFLTGLIVSVPFLISYGVLIFLFARQNRETLGSYIYIASICFLVGFSLDLINLGGNLITIFLIFDILTLVGEVSFVILYLGTNLISLVGFVFFLIHGVNNRDINFKMAGILYFIGYGISFIFSFLISSFFIFSHFVS